jgi:hypothetical protein
MQIASAQLPQRDNSDDKVFTTTNAVIMLDGASAFRPIPVPASLYADQLGTYIRDELQEDDQADLREALRRAIVHTALDLDLVPGDSPSSTVAIARLRDDWIDALVLGDSPIVLPGRILCDDRIDQLDLPERQQYRQRLATGTGYDECHRDLLRKLQNRQVQHRNVNGGYWIAEADPNAALHAIITQHQVTDTPWTVLATDGAFNTIQHTRIATWPTVAEYDRIELVGLLDRCQQWEADHDPDGQRFPRAKRHDDKAIAAVRWTA